MPRPARPQWVTRTYARRRHRTWMLAMTLATLGWAVWWTSLLLQRFWPAQAPGLGLTATLACVFAVPGALISVLTLRASRSWMFFATLAFFANASLFAMPWLASELFD